MVDKLTGDIAPDRYGAALLIALRAGCLVQELRQVVVFVQ